MSELNGIIRNLHVLNQSLQLGIPIAEIKINKDNNEFYLPPQKNNIEIIYDFVLDLIRIVLSKLPLGIKDPRVTYAQQRDKAQRIIKKILKNFDQIFATMESNGHHQWINDDDLKKFHISNTVEHLNNLEKHLSTSSWVDMMNKKISDVWKRENCRIGYGKKLAEYLHQIHSNLNLAILAEALLQPAGPLQIEPIIGRLSSLRLKELLTLLETKKHIYFPSKESLEAYPLLIRKILLLTSCKILPLDSNNDKFLEILLNMESNSEILARLTPAFLQSTCLQSVKLQEALWKTKNAKIAFEYLPINDTWLQNLNLYFPSEEEQKLICRRMNSTQASELYDLANTDEERKKMLRITRAKIQSKNPQHVCTFINHQISEIWKNQLTHFLRRFSKKGMLDEFFDHKTLPFYQFLIISKKKVDKVFTSEQNLQAFHSYPKKFKMALYHRMTTQELLKVASPVEIVELLCSTPYPIDLSKEDSDYDNKLLQVLKNALNPEYKAYHAKLFSKLPFPLILQIMDYFPGQDVLDHFPTMIAESRGDYHKNNSRFTKDELNALFKHPDVQKALEKIHFLNTSECTPEEYTNYLSKIEGKIHWVAIKKLDPNNLEGLKKIFRHASNSGGPEKIIPLLASWAVKENKIELLKYLSNYEDVQFEDSIITILAKDPACLAKLKKSHPFHPAVLSRQEYITYLKTTQEPLLFGNNPEICMEIILENPEIIERFSVSDLQTFYVTINKLIVLSSTTQWSAKKKSAFEGQISTLCQNVIERYKGEIYGCKFPPQFKNQLEKLGPAQLDNFLRRCSYSQIQQIVPLIDKTNLLQLELIKRKAELDLEQESK